MKTNQRTTKPINGFSHLNRIAKISFCWSLILIFTVSVPLHAELQTESVEQQTTTIPADTLKSEAELQAERELRNKRIREILAKGTERALEKKARRQERLIFGWIGLIIWSIILIAKRHESNN